VSVPVSRAPATARPLFLAATRDGPLDLSPPEGARTAHDCFDGLPLGVYSALRTFDRVNFLRLEQHLDRTDRSLELGGSRERIDRPRLRAALHAAVQRFASASDQDAFVRFDWLAAPAPRLGTDERLLIALSAFAPVPESFLREGVGVGLSTLQRRTPLVKSARFVLERRPHPLGTRETFENLLLDERQHILEGTSSNFLAVEGGRLRRTGDAALQGITQRFVCELAAELGLEVSVDPVPLGEVGRLDEAFLTGSSRGIVPVVAIDGRCVGQGRPGPWTRRLLDHYLERARADARPACAGGTP
jgi:branched-chain amino acid aminotransferase